MMLAYQNLRILFFVAIALTAVSCHKPVNNSKNAMVPAKNPEWLEQKILGFQQVEPYNPPAKIYSYQYRNQPVFYITGRCCDIPGELYDAEGRQLCQPDGGITGRGDGKCPDFFETRTNEKLIWEDLRK